MPYADRDMALARARKRYAVHREEDIVRRKAAYHAADKTVERAKRRAWYEANIDRAKALERARQYKIMYGITVADYDAMLAAQGGGCAICGADQPSQKKSSGVRYHHKHFAVDHCHDSGKVRGLLCVACNVHLGMAEKWYAKHKDKIHGYLGRAL